MWLTNNSILMSVYLGMDNDTSKNLVDKLITLCENQIKGYKKDIEVAQKSISCKTSEIETLLYIRKKLDVTVAEKLYPTSLSKRNTFSSNTCISCLKEAASKKHQCPVRLLLNGKTNCNCCEICTQSCQERTESLSKIKRK